jgi:biofilm PGA synthesis protein PgaA
LARHVLREVLGAALFGALAGAVFTTGVTAAADVSDMEYDAAVRAARAGDFDNALPVIERRRIQNPFDLSAAYDYLVVLGWANRLAEAVAAYEALPAGQPPAYVEAAAARDYRGLGQYDNALALYEEGRQHYPQNLDFAYGEILTLTDAKRAGEAIDQGNTLLASNPDDTQLLSALLYALQTTDRHAETLAIANHLAQLDPSDREARRQQITQMGELGDWARALELAGQSRELFSDPEMRRFAVQEAAAAIRAGDLPGSNEAEKNAQIDRAIAELERQITKLSTQGPASSPELLASRFDRVVLLGDRARVDEIIAEYQASLRERIDLPAYVLKVIADAYETRRDPQTARRLYEAALAGAPDDFQARIGLFYAEIESEDFDAAFNTIDRLAAEQVEFVQMAGAAAPVLNPAWLRAQLAAAMARYYAGDAAEAEKRVRSLIALAPENASLKQALGSILSGRGKPRAADAQFAAAQRANPNDIDIAAARADIAVTLGDRAGGTAALDGVRLRAPSNRSVQRLSDRLDIIGRPEAILRFNGSFQGANVPVGGDSFSLDAQFFSAPIKNAYRLYVNYGFATAKLPEGDIINHHAALGLEYTAPDFGASAEVTQDSAPRWLTGARGSLALALSDAWRISAFAQLYSSDTPLRAMKHDITANSWGARLGYSPSEGKAYNLLTEMVTFSDSNVRTVVDASSTQRLFTSPHLTLDAIPELYASWNTLRDAPYYNPLDDLSGSLSVVANQILYRRYSFVYSHNLGVSAGEYWEHSFGGRLAASLTYEQRLRVNDVWEGSLGVRYRRQPYDGHGEDSLSLFAGIDWRF